MATVRRPRGIFGLGATIAMAVILAGLTWPSFAEAQSDGPRVAEHAELSDAEAHAANAARDRALAVIAQAEAAIALARRENNAEAESIAQGALETARRALALAEQRSYRHVGNGLVGGTGWRTGYYVPIGASPEVRARALERLREQSRLAGRVGRDAYEESVDLDLYNFVIGIAASTSEWTDLNQRVRFDQLHNGQASRDQEGYNALKYRRFDELGCHSNGAMICLAALWNHDVRADRVVLYGPQITPESLAMWNELLATHRISSLQIYLNENDPVPPLALLFNTAPTARVVWRARPIFFNVQALRQTVQELSPQAELHTFSCGDHPTKDCHSMAVYSADRNCADAQRAPVPGTRTPNGQSVLSPPGLQCPH
jgi:hypothetical protein